MPRPCAPRAARACSAGVEPTGERPRMLVLVSDRIGDVIFTTPALRFLRDSAPAAHVTVLAQSAAAEEVLRGNPCVDRVVLPDTLDALAREPRVSLLVDLKNNRVSRAVAERLGVAPAAVIRRHGEDPEAEAALACMAQALGVPQRGAGPPGAARGYELYASPADEARASGLLAEAGIEAGDVLVGCHPGCNRVARRGWRIWKPATHPKAWPIESFAALARRLAETRPEIRLVLTGSRGERDLARVLLRAAPRSVDLLGRTSVPELFAVLRRMRLFLTADTGPLHVACAAGVPLVALFGTTPASRFGPWPPAPHRVVLQGSPVAAIGVETVRDAVLAGLADQPWETPAGKE